MWKRPESVHGVPECPDIACASLREGCAQSFDSGLLKNDFFPDRILEWIRHLTP